jgi:hypothetical protein
MLVAFAGCSRFVGDGALRDVRSRFRAIRDKEPLMNRNIAMRGKSP